ncbi:MauE/DoxX family redox-associated membrane protein [Paenibacillus xylanexedens]|uniref:MauE/DoxX family redox-associated membrane protein n=1 Tax=Paenibacillus xylanexedens TaxID=528191 RepID=UPI003D06C942
MKYILYSLIDLILFIIFFKSLFHKIVESHDFIYEVYIILKKKAILAYFSIVAIESLLLFCIFFNILPWKSFIAFGLLLMFTFYLLFFNKKNGSNCICFGRESKLNNYPILRNIILIFVVTVQYSIYPSEAIINNDLRYSILLMICSCMVFVGIIKKLREVKEYD